MSIRAPGTSPIRPNPTVVWSQRDNNNYEETALLSTLSYFAQNAKLFLNNFYLKSKRSVEKPDNEGPAAYVLAQDDSVVEPPDAVVESAGASARRDSALDASGYGRAAAATAQGQRGSEASPPHRRRLPRLSLPAALSFAWTSLSRAWPMPCSIANTGRPTIRKRRLMTTRAGLSAISSTPRFLASPTGASFPRRCRPFPTSAKSRRRRLGRDRSTL